MRVAIIGAGIIGLYLAWKLSEKGHKVTVFEKRNVIGKETCSGLFSERILDFFPESRKLVQNEINFVLIHFPRKTIRVEFAKKFLVMSHAELDRLAASLAQSSGAEIKFGCETLPDHVSSFDKIVGCDGANSAVRKWLSLPKPKYRLGIQGFIPERNFDNYVETWPVKQGFTWKIPRGKETEYGIIAKPKGAEKLLEDFLNKNNLRIERQSTALVPQGFLIPKNQKITLCGDAAGLTKPWSGGGVIWGLKAADILLQNFPDFIKYRWEAKKFFLPEIALSKMATKAIYFLGFKLPWLLLSKIKMEGDYALRNNY